MAVTRNLSISLHRRERYESYLYILRLESLFPLPWIVHLHHEAEQETADQPPHDSHATQVHSFVWFHLPPHSRFDLLSAALHPHMGIFQLNIRVQYPAHGQPMGRHRGFFRIVFWHWEEQNSNLRYLGSKPKQLKPGSAGETCAQQVVLGDAIWIGRAVPWALGTFRVGELYNWIANLHWCSIIRLEESKGNRIEGAVQLHFKPVGL